jgi:hypothetical protein
MIHDALSCARDEFSVSDYTLFAKRAIGPGMAYYDRVRILDELLGAKFVIESSGRLILNESPDLSLFESELINGFSDVWKLDIFFPQAFRKFQDNSQLLAEIGLRGEKFVIAHLETLLPASRTKMIRHVSIYDDSAGYDIFSPSTTGEDHGYLLEVKTSVQKSAKLTLFITRNEIEVAIRNRNWRLVGVEINDGIPKLLGYLDASELIPLLPQEKSKNFQWTQLRINLDKAFFIPGLP